MSKKEKCRKIAAIGLLLSGAALAGTASAEITPESSTFDGIQCSIAVDGDTVTLTNVAVNGLEGIQSQYSHLELSQFDEPDKNLVINF